MEAKDKIIVALDVNSLDKVRPLVIMLAPYIGCFKIGLELLTAVGAPQAVNYVQALGGQVFFDGKFDDTPHTIGRAAKAVSAMGVKMFDVHASAEIEAMKAAVANKGNSLVLAVTVLTSIDENNTTLIDGGKDGIRIRVMQMAYAAKSAGCDAIICSPQELELLNRHQEFDGLFRVTPGIRPQWAPANDQKRFMTPAEAVSAGATYLVIGRPITDPPEEIGTPVEAVKMIIEEITAVL
ncbi:MAG: orotidine-5'-phosphate decarboxylase [Candidatus Buchananbacteria bacterium]|nr:orotidine-5'-phosphate decarboxylase [Candidatus Buchananbacteria bacterium]